MSKSFPLETTLFTQLHKQLTGMLVRFDNSEDEKFELFKNDTYKMIVDALEQSTETPETLFASMFVEALEANKCDLTDFDFKSQPKTIQKNILLYLKYGIKIVMDAIETTDEEEREFMNLEYVERNFATLLNNLQQFPVTKKTVFTFTKPSDRMMMPADWKEQMDKEYKKN